MTNEFPPRRADVADEALAALKIVLQHGRIDDSKSRMNQVAAAIAKLEASWPSNQYS